MSSASEPLASPSVRAIVRWGLPLHWVVPAVCGLLGLVLLLVGGTVAVFGGWWLATAFPVAIGGFHRDRRAALVPAGFWVAWCLIGVVAGPDAGLANTPPVLAVVLAFLGGSATLLAQRAVFPATDPEVWEHHGERADGGADAGGDTVALEPLPLDDDEDLDPALADTFEVEDGDEDGAVPPVDSAGNAERAEPEAEPEAPEEPAATADDEAEAEDDHEAEAEPEAATEAEPEPEPKADDDAVADAPPAAKSAPPHELPLDADPSLLDEGGHPTEFAALSPPPGFASQGADGARGGTSDVDEG